MGLVSDILGGINDFFGTGYNIYQDQRNYNYQQNLQKELFKRDDNAMQRRMADLSAAGINPLMSINSGVAANTSTGVNQADYVASPDLKILKRRQQRQDLDVGEKQIEGLEKDNQLKQISIDTKELELEILRKQLKQFEDNGYYPMSFVGKSVMDINNVAGNVLGNLFQTEKQNLLDPFSVFSEIINSPRVESGKNFIKNFQKKEAEKHTVPDNVFNFENPLKTLKQKAIEQKVWNNQVNEWNKAIKNQNSNLELRNYGSYFKVYSKRLHKEYDKHYTNLTQMRRDFNLPFY